MVVIDFTGEYYENFRPKYYWLNYYI